MENTDLTIPPAISLLEMPNHCIIKFFQDWPSRETSSYSNLLFLLRMRSSFFFEWDIVCKDVFESLKSFNIVA